LYTKIHHALCDGVTAMKLLESSMSPDPTERGMPQPWERRPKGSMFDEPDPDEVARPPLPGAAADRWSAVRADGLRRRGSPVTDSPEGVVGATDGIGHLLPSFRDQSLSSPLRAPRSMLSVPITGARRFAADSWSIDRIRAAAA